VIAELTSEIRTAPADHVDGATFPSRCGDPKTTICPATILAEMGDCRDWYPNCHSAHQRPIATTS
jgi:hypothetical protein